MYPRTRWLAVAIAAILVAPALHADVNTREKVLVKFEGMLGGMSRMFGGSAARDGVTTAMALKGSRSISMGETSGEIIDMSEEKVYRIDVKRKEYKVSNFST